MYSDLVVDKATIDCRLSFQLIVFTYRVNMYPKMDLLLSKSLTKYASTKSDNSEIVELM